jgi:hypothetical protein
MEVLGQLAGGIAHDFNNMLMVLTSSAELLERTLPARSKGRPYLEQFQRTTERAAAITRQLLACSRKQVLDAKPVDLHEDLTESEFMLARLLGSDITLTLAPRSAFLAAGRSFVARAGHRESRHQCPRRHAMRRKPHDFHQQRQPTSLQHFRTGSRRNSSTRLVRPAGAPDSVPRCTASCTSLVGRCSWTRRRAPARASGFSFPSRNHAQPSPRPRPRRKNSSNNRRSRPAPHARSQFFSSMTKSRCAQL